MVRSDAGWQANFNGEDPNQEISSLKGFKLKEKFLHATDKQVLTLTLTLILILILIVSSLTLSSLTNPNRRVTLNARGRLRRTSPCGFYSKFRLKQLHLHLQLQGVATLARSDTRVYSYIPGYNYLITWVYSKSYLGILLAET